jgi:hypothetical protein
MGTPSFSIDSNKVASYGAKTGLAFYKRGMSKWEDWVYQWQDYVDTKVGGLYDGSAVVVALSFSGNGSNLTGIPLTSGTGDARVDGALTLQAGKLDDSTSYDISVYAGFTDLVMFYDTSSGAWGVNTNSPDSGSKLDVNGIIRAQSGIQPNANAVTANETLDDYEQGDHAVTLTPQTSGSYTMASGQDAMEYHKVGDHVTLSGTARVGSSSSPVGALRINLPFTAKTGTELEHRSSAALLITGGGTTLSVPYVRIIEGTAQAEFLVSDANTQLNLDASNVDSAFDFSFCISYFAV